MPCQETQPHVQQSHSGEWDESSSIANMSIDHSLARAEACLEWFERCASPANTPAVSSPCNVHHPVSPESSSMAPWDDRCNAYGGTAQNGNGRCCSHSEGMGGRQGQETEGADVKSDRRHRAFFFHDDDACAEDGAASDQVRPRTISIEEVTAEIEVTHAAKQHQHHSFR